MKKIITIILSICILLTMGGFIAGADAFYFGDVDNSGGEVNTSDASYLAGVILGVNSSNSRADINEDNKVDIVDLVALENMVVEKENAVEIPNGSYTDIADNNQ